MKLPHGYPTPFDFDMALQEPVFYMMNRGIRIDLDKRRELSGRFHGEWGDLQGKLDAVYGGELNAMSPKQVGEYLYGDLGLPPRKLGGRPTTNEDALRSLVALCQSEYNKKKTDKGKRKWLEGFVAIMLILKIRTIRKRISSYIDIDLDGDGRVRSTLSVGGTETFRFSSSKTLWGTGCNLQTIPHELRVMFIADEGKELAEFDLNRGESWIYSHLAADPEMMRIHEEMGDFHAETACAISSLFGESIHINDWDDWYEQDKPRGFKLRFLGKKSNHAFAYRMGPFRAAEVVNSESDDTGITITGSEAKKMRELWMQKYACIPQWWSEVEKKMQESRSITTIFGRTRTFYQRWGESLFKEATAYEPQCTSVDYMNTGMLEVFKSLVQPKTWGLELLHQNHDSILVQYDIDYRDRVMHEIPRLVERDITVNGYTFTIPAEGSYGPSWGKLTEWSDAKAA